MNLNFFPQNDERAHRILALWYQGNTLGAIGSRYNLSRERIRQIIEKQLRKKVIDKFLNYNISEKELQEIDLNSFVNLEKKAVREMKERKLVSKAIEKVSDSKLNPNNFYSVKQFARALKINRGIIEKYFPEIVEFIIANEETRRQRWSRNYSKCRICGTTSIKHHSLGFCRKCYIKSDHFKNIQNRSRMKNREKRREKHRAYLKEYLKRPEVMVRKRQEADFKFISGNREKIIQKAKNQCSFCHIPRQRSYDKYGKDLYVIHLGDKQDNSLDNLLVLCMGCFHKKEQRAEQLPHSFKQILGKDQSVDSIINLVANYYGVRSNAIIGKRRKKEFVTPRMVTIFLIRNNLGVSFPQIGRVLGGRDHTTIIHAHKQISKDYNENEKIKKDIEKLKELIEK